MRRSMGMLAVVLSATWLSAGEAEALAPQGRVVNKNAVSSVKKTSTDARAHTGCGSGTRCGLENTRRPGRDAGREAAARLTCSGKLLLKSTRSAAKCVACRL